MAEASESVLDHPLIRQLAEQYHKTPAQIVLRWGCQRGTAVIPKTNHIERLPENLDVFEFQLSAAELAAISGLNQNRRFNDPGVFCEKAFNTFFPIFD
jgi:D-xylose reductase